MINPIIKITKALFIQIIESIKKQHNHDRGYSKNASKIFPNAFEANLDYDNSVLQNQLLSIIKDAFKDNNRDSWIDYFLWELDFGKDYKEGMATNEDGSSIDLSDSSKLYDFLIENN